MTIKNRTSFLSTIALMAGLSTAPAQAGDLAGDMNGIFQALKDATPLVDLRLRYEGVDQDGKVEDADAVTFRARVGLESAAYHDTKILVEFEHVGDWVDDYNDTFNGKGQFPVVADPADTQLNRLQLVNTSLPDTKVTIGRQRIILGDARFVGNVGWRQNEQTFDAIRVENTSIDNLTIDVTYAEEVLRIFGSDSPKGQFDSESWFANATLDVPLDDAKLSVTGFAYMLDFDNAKASSSQTFGGVISGWKGNVGLKASYAAQSDYADQPVTYDESYYLIEAAYKINSLNLFAGYEVLTGDGVKGFATPLATAHAFNGYADVFLATPGSGLEDIYGKAVYKFKKFGPFDSGKLVAIYHDFQAEATNQDFGTELDLIAVANKGPLTFVAKYAGYDKDTFAADIDRLWLQVGFKLGKVK